MAAKREERSETPPCGRSDNIWGRRVMVARRYVRQGWERAVAANREERSETPPCGRSDKGWVEAVGQRVFRRGRQG